MNISCSTLFKQFPCQRLVMKKPRTSQLHSCSAQCVY